MGGLTMLYVSTSVPKCQVGNKQLACHWPVTGTWYLPCRLVGSASVALGLPGDHSFNPTST
jgi:hypothetical protein